MRVPRGPVRRVHRLAWETIVGPIPADMTLDHLCRNKSCWNPAHLEIVTAVENWRRGPNNIALQRKRRTHCPSGHPYDDVNTYINPRGERRCRECNRDQCRRRHNMRRSATAAESPRRLEG
ncbi:MAG: HNH endonuclease [Chloroflexi bacterium]|nr:HNH endonuclease [Chloroflexota bacterium]